MEINHENYRDMLIRYLENELNANERAKVIDYISRDSDAAREWELLQNTRLKPDLSVTFMDKSSLYRREEEPEKVRKIFGGPLYRFTALAAAAAILAFAVIIYMGRGRQSLQTASRTHTISPEKPLVKQDDAVNPEEMAMATDGHKKQKMKNSQNHKKDGQSDTSLTGRKKSDKTPMPVPDRKPTIIIVDKPEQDNLMADINTGIPGIEGNFDADMDMNGHLVSIDPYSPDGHSGQPGNTVDDDKTLAGLFFDFLNKISVKKEKINDKTFYALSIETDNIKINKTFKSLTGE